MKKKTICLLIMLVLAVFGVLFFAVPKPLLPKGDIWLVSVERCDGRETVDVTDQVNMALLLEQLETAQCRRIIDSAYNYHGEDARYQIKVAAGSSGPFYILLGEPDGKGEASLMNKAYYPTQNGIFPTLRYKVIDPEALIAWLDAEIA